MNEKKIVNLCQLAMRARKTVFGGQLISAIQTGKVKAVICSSDMGANTKKKIYDKSRTYGVPVIEMNPEALAAISSKPLKALGITDAGFGQAVLKAKEG